MFQDSFNYKYCPILAISPSELVALKELPDKDKKIILPVFPIKSWATATKLSNAIDKVDESVGKNNMWIADIDHDDLESRPSDKRREVHFEIEKLTDSSNGYKNWVHFIASKPNIVPCIQKADLDELPEQVKNLEVLKRGIVLILQKSDMQMGLIQQIVGTLNPVESLLIILDLGQIDKEQIDFKEQIKNYLMTIKRLLPKALLSLSSTSFPSSFGGYYRGTNTIYERSLYDKIKLEIEDLIYSDRGSTRATKQTGASGPPPPRIDYACENEWHFIRKEFSDSLSALGVDEKKIALKSEKKRLYTEISKEIKLQGYWENDLDLYANYLIELTSKGDVYGIDSPQKATAVRINKHLFTQLHYDELYVDTDTDDDWVDL
jgi:hypothetical protein